jgi:hypothetical protein
MAASASHAIDGLGEHAVDVPVVCQLTRFGLRGPRHLALTYADHRRIARDIGDSTVPGLLHSAFLIENPSTCYSLSFWSGPPHFSAEVPRHIEVAGRVFGRVSVDSESRPEVWSTKWRLASVTNNLSWDGFDLRSVIAGGTHAG